MRFDDDFGASLLFANAGIGSDWSCITFHSDGYISVGVDVDVRLMSASAAEEPMWAAEREPEDTIRTCFGI